MSFKKTSILNNNKLFKNHVSCVINVLIFKLLFKQLALLTTKQI